MRIDRARLAAMVMITLVAPPLSLWEAPAHAQSASFTNPLLPGGPDPWITRGGGTYYYLATVGDRIDIWQTRDVTELAHAQRKTVWTPPAGGPNSVSIWAPELHRIGGRWFIYYTAAERGHDDDAHRGIFVLENANADPTTGEWRDRGRLNTRFPGIDGTTFEYAGRRYFVYSPYVGPDSDLAIAPMTNPWTLGTPEVIIARPDLPWERQGGRQILEGPEFLEGPRGDLFLTYSASACWSDDYALGLLSAAPGSDPLKAGVWKKAASPVLAKSSATGVYGTGHNGFFKSPDGRENWIVYHGNSGPGMGCTSKRAPRIQRFTFDEDGRPSFGEPKVGPMAKPSGTPAEVKFTSSSAAALLEPPPGAPVAPFVDPHKAYLFAHMTNEHYGVLYYSVSLDGLHWQRINGGRPVSSDYHGHASIAEGPDGRYYLVGNKGDDDPLIRFWVSDDLIRWAPFGTYRPELRGIPGLEHALQRIGAPKLFFDRASGQFLLTWHTPTVEGSADDPERYWASQRTLYVVSRDLKTFAAAPRRLFNWNMATIDTIVRPNDNGGYCAIIKDERYPSYDWTTGKTIRISCATSLLGPYPPPGPPLSPNFREAPTLIRSPDNKDWLLYYEQYAGASYGLSKAPTLAGPWYQVSGNTTVPAWDRYSMPPHTRHGSMLEISREQYDAIVKAFPGEWR